TRLARGTREGARFQRERPPGHARTSSRPARVRTSQAPASRNASMHTPADASAIEHLFLYGTLMRGEAAHARFGLATRAVYVGDACVAGQLHELDGYPTLVPGGGRVEGEVHRLLDPGLLAELDLYEACDPVDEANSG